MLITDSFVFLNNPKTGSTFARDVLKSIYQKRGINTLFNRLMYKTGIRPRPFIIHAVPNIRLNHSADHGLTKHGCYSQIPEAYSNRPVYSVVRNPVSKFLSAYEYGFWKKRVLLPADILERHFPKFPDLSIEEYLSYRQLTMVHGKLNGKKPKANAGSQTIQFIRMFFKDAERIIQNLTDEYLDSEQVFDDLGDISFIRQENLNEELAAVLGKHGFSKKEQDFIRNHKRVNKTRPKTRKRESLLNRPIFDHITETERLIFRICEDKGIRYSRTFEEYKQYFSTPAE